MPELSDDVSLKDRPDFSLIIPLCNEAESIPSLEREIWESLAGMPCEVIYVDDGSIDGTAERITPLPATRIIRFAKTSGQSAAILAGIRESQGQIIVLMDGDLQNDPADIPKLLAEIRRGADLVCGYRAKRRDPVFKKITGRFANEIRRRVLGDEIRDTGCTLKAMRRKCLADLIPFKGMHRFIPALIKRAGFKVVEIPVNHRPRKFGSSKYGFGNRFLRTSLDMLGVLWLQSRWINYEYVKPAQSIEGEGGRSQK